MEAIIAQCHHHNPPSPSSHPSSPALPAYKYQSVFCTYLKARRRGARAGKSTSRMHCKQKADVDGMKRVNGSMEQVDDVNDGSMEQ